MKRRSFINSILGAVASLALAQKIALEAVKLDVVRWIPNPAYQTAEFEILYLFHADVFQEISGPFPEGQQAKEPERYSLIDGEFVKIDREILSQ